MPSKGGLRVKRAIPLSPFLGHQTDDIVLLSLPLFRQALYTVHCISTSVRIVHFKSSLYHTHSPLLHSDSGQDMHDMVRCCTVSYWAVLPKVLYSVL